jgi:hypothetical protein
MPLRLQTPGGTILSGFPRQASNLEGILHGTPASDRDSNSSESAVYIHVIMSIPSQAASFSRRSAPCQIQTRSPSATLRALEVSWPLLLMSLSGRCMLRQLWTTMVGRLPSRVPFRGLWYGACPAPIDTFTHPWYTSSKQAVPITTITTPDHRVLAASRAEPGGETVGASVTSLASQTCPWWLLRPT